MPDAIADHLVQCIFNILALGLGPNFLCFTAEPAKRSPSVTIKTASETLFAASKVQLRGLARTTFPFFPYPSPPGSGL
jgi:hypothetical protein